MIPVDQDKFKPEAGPGAGNCMQASVASLLELPLEDVPHFAAFEGEDEWWTEFLDFAWSQGFSVVQMDMALGPHSLGLMSGPSPRGDWWHTVVSKGDDVAHDPHPSRDGLKRGERSWWYLVPHNPRS